jgi:hypothetical protein
MEQILEATDPASNFAEQSINLIIASGTPPVIATSSVHGPLLLKIERVEASPSPCSLFHLSILAPHARLV